MRLSTRNPPRRCVGGRRPDERRMGGPLLRFLPGRRDVGPEGSGREGRADGPRGRRPKPDHRVTSRSGRSKSWTATSALKLLNGGLEGVAEWNRRRAAGEEVPDLSGALPQRGRPPRQGGLRKANLGGADLPGADLGGAKLARPTSAWPSSARPISSRPTSARPTSSGPTSSGPTSSGPTSAGPTSSRPTLRGRPPRGQPHRGQPQRGRPQQGRPPRGQPPRGRPQRGRPQRGRPQRGRPQRGRPHPCEADPVQTRRRHLRRGRRDRMPRPGDDRQAEAAAPAPDRGSPPLDGRGRVELLQPARDRRGLPDRDPQRRGPRGFPLPPGRHRRQGVGIGVHLTGEREEAGGTVLRFQAPPTPRSTTSCRSC